jgi:hypothetical protein
MLLTLPLRSKRDAVAARQRARQVAKVLHFDPVDQACIAAGAFAIAVQALRRNKRGQLCVQLERETLVVFAQSAREPWPTLRLSKPLPSAKRGLGAEDVAFVVEQLEALAPLDLFEEFQAQNQEMLTLLHALQRAREDLTRPERASVPSRAA